MRDISMTNSGGFRYSHFGVDITSKKFPILNEGTYLVNRDIDSETRGKLLFNYGLNIRRYDRISKKTFDKTVDTFVKEYGFEEIKDLNEVKDKMGYYLMVLDAFKQVYVGISNDICKRIIDHWKKIMPTDRLIFGTPEISTLSINSFGAFDTTRIYARLDPFAMDIDFTREDEFISFFPKEWFAIECRVVLFTDKYKHAPYKSHK